MQGNFSRENILENKNIELQESPAIEDNAEISDGEMLDSVEDFNEENEEIAEEKTKKVEPKGAYNLLNLDEVEAYKTTAVATHTPPDPSASWKDRQNRVDNGKEFIVAGLITDYSIRDAQRSGEKVAFLTLEDYTGSYSFRLGDRDYMKLKDKIAVQRFVILKIKYAVLQDGRCFINVIDVLELSETFNNFAKSMTVIVPLNELKEEDLEFFKNSILKEKGNQRLYFYIKNPADDTGVKLLSSEYKIEISDEMLRALSHANKYQVYLN